MITGLIALSLIILVVVSLTLPENTNCNQDCNQGRDCDCGDKNGL